MTRPAVGRLACGDTGAGKMPEPDELFDIVEYIIGGRIDAQGAGGREALSC